jgi:hypothetical protein
LLAGVEFGQFTLQGFMSPTVLDLVRFEATDFPDALLRSTVMFLWGVMFEDHQDALERTIL